MNGLMYKIASKTQSRRVHELIYGSAAIHFRAVDLDSTFQFECKMTGNCCRGRCASANLIVGESQLIPITKFRFDKGKPIAGLAGNRLWLDGEGDLAKAHTVAEMRVGRDKAGVRYVGSTGRDCQFLEGNLCGIHPVKPVLCKTAPIGGVVEHSDFDGTIYLALHVKPECPECFGGATHTVRDWLGSAITNDYLNDLRQNDGWPRIIRMDDGANVAVL